MSSVDWHPTNRCLFQRVFLDLVRSDFMSEIVSAMPHLVHHLASGFKWAGIESRLLHWAKRAFLGAGLLSLVHLVSRLSLNLHVLLAISIRANHLSLRLKCKDVRK